MHKLTEADSSTRRRIVRRMPDYSSSAAGNRPYVLLRKVHRSACALEQPPSAHDDSWLVRLSDKFGSVAAVERSEPGLIPVPHDLAIQLQQATTFLRQILATFGLRQADLDAQVVSLVEKRL